MKTRYTIQYWYMDEHDTLDQDCDTLNQARKFANGIDTTKYKDITIYARHWHKINNSFEHNGILYNNWQWEVIPDDYYKDYSIHKS